MLYEELLPHVIRFSLHLSFIINLALLGVRIMNPCAAGTYRYTFFHPQLSTDHFHCVNGYTCTMQGRLLVV